MKFWQKVFLSVLVIFVIAFNMGIFVVMHFTYREQLNSVKQRAMGEAYFLTYSISRDFGSISSTSSLTGEKKRAVYQSYAEYYEGQNVFLELWEGKNRIGGYFDIPFHKREEMNTKDHMQNIIIREKGQTEYLFLACNLEEPFGNHRLVIVYPLTELEYTRTQLVHIVIFVDIIISILLSVILYVIIKKLMKPLHVLTGAAEEIAKGNYNQKINIKSRDEVGDLAVKFNAMSEKIQETICLLKEEDEKKQQLIDNMAHELRTPLTSISGYADYIRMAALSEDERIHALDYIIAETRRLEKLSRTLLMIADVREGALLKTRVSTEQLKCYIQNLFFKQVSEKGIQLKVDCKTAEIEGNEALLECLLGNLIENAVRACEEKGKIKVTFLKEKNTCLLVEDNGIGMAPEEVTKIMEPFYRVDKNRSRKNGGVGLGVTLCQKIVELHQGRLIYESELQKGTRVTVTFFTT